MRKVYPKNVPVICKSCKETRMLDAYYAKRAMGGNCAKCSRRLGGSSEKRPGRVTGESTKCMHCQKEYWRYKFLKDTRKFCSKECSDDHKRVYEKVDKKCLQCQQTFTTSNKPFSNSAGNFCSIKCRDNSYLKPDKFIRSGWKKFRNLFFKSGNDFCFKCYSKENLQVHHLVPHSITKDNRPENLVTLCKTCHKLADKITMKAWRKSHSYGELVSSIIGAKLEDKWHFYKGSNLNDNNT